MGVFASTTAFSSGFLRRWIIACIALFLVFFFLSTDRLTLTGPSLKPSTWLESHNAGTTPITTTESVGHDGFITPLRAPPSSSTPLLGEHSPFGNHTHSLALVVASLAEEETTWARSLIGLMPNLTPLIYIVDAPAKASLIPINKGHEAMPYLTYIIKYYDKLPDVSMFMHAHQYTWHNNDLIDSDSSLMVQKLNPAKVVRDGYVNLRCHHDPGCPAHLHPAGITEDTADINRPEELYVAQAWRELFPGTDVPEVLSQPCCAQFALSRDRLQSIPLSEYVRHRNWIINTHLDDAVAGRVWEYVWQYLWTGQWEFCPVEHVCYCDLYGICFGGKEEYDAWFEKRLESRKLEDEWNVLKEEDEKKPGTGVLETPHALNLMVEWMKLVGELERGKSEATERGLNPKLRAQEIGRKWTEGDGF